MIHAKDLYGQKIGEVDGKDFFGIRVKPPLSYLTVQKIDDESLHGRILLITDRGIWYAPTCHFERYKEFPNKHFASKIIARPLFLTETFTVHDAVVYDFTAQERTRPVGLKVPMLCERGTTISFTFCVWSKNDWHASSQRR